MKTNLFYLAGVILIGSCIQSQHPQEEAPTDDSSFNFLYSSKEFEQSSMPEDSFKTEHKKIGFGKARSAVLEVSIPAGILSVKGGTPDLAEVAVKYRRERKFLVKQELTGDNLYAKIYMPKLEGLKEITNDRTVCSMRLNEKVPMELTINLGAGKGKFSLGELNLKSVSLSLGVGEFAVDLKSTTATSLKVNAGVGKAIVDLSGKRTDDLDAEFNCGIGELNLILPRSSGVKVSLSGLIGNVDMGGMIRKGGFYYNDSWDKKTPRIRVDINGGMGDVKIKLAEQ